MKVAVTGSSGFIGSSLCSHLISAGHEVWRLVRRPVSQDKEIYWDPEVCLLNAGKLEGMDAVVHLAGENIGRRPWSEKQKRKIYDSRVNGTRILSDAMASLENPPAVFVSASAVGFYGDRGDEFLSEESPAGDGFLAALCQDWEAAAMKAEEKGIRVVTPRFGVVLSRSYGMLPKMVRSFRIGVGGVVGTGRQYISWVSRKDVVRALSFILTHESLQGPVNVVNLNSLTNAALTQILSRVLKVWLLLPTPTFLVSLFLGEMGRELLLSSQRVVPKELLKAGFRFEDENLEMTLMKMLR